MVVYDLYVARVENTMRVNDDAYVTAEEVYFFVGSYVGIEGPPQGQMSYLYVKRRKCTSS